MEFYFTILMDGYPGILWWCQAYQAESFRFSYLIPSLVVEPVQFKEDSRAGERSSEASGDNSGEKFAAGSMAWPLRYYNRRGHWPSGDSSRYLPSPLHDALY